MPKRKPTRSQRRRGPAGYTQRATPRPPAPATPAPAPLDPLAPVSSVGVAPAIPAEQVREHIRDRQITRFTARDYSYVKRELMRIAVLATAIIVAIVVISFFLP